MERNLTEYEKKLISEYDFHPAVKARIAKAWQQNREVKEPGSLARIIPILVGNIFPLLIVIILAVSTFAPESPVARLEKIAVSIVWSVYVALLFFIGILGALTQILLAKDEKDYYSHYALIFAFRHKSSLISRILYGLIYFSIILMLAWLDHVGAALSFLIATLFYRFVTLKAENKIMVINEEVVRQDLKNQIKW